MDFNVMNYLSNMDQNSKFLLVIIAIISVLLVLIFIFNFLSNRKANAQKRMQRAYKKKLIREIEEDSKNIVVEKKEIKRKSVNTPVKETVVPVNEVKIEPTIQASNVVKEPEEEVIEILQDDDESDVDRILREIKEASKEDNINLNEFEREQEETAIISYDELCRRAGVKKKIYKAAEEPEIIDTKKEEKAKYRPSKIVSPIFGVQEEKQKPFMQIKDTEDEMDLDQTFLKNLKEFRSGLE